MQTHPNAASAHSDALRMLQQHPEINVLVAFNEATAVGAVQAVQEMGRSMTSGWWRLTPMCRRSMRCKAAQWTP